MTEIIKFSLTVYGAVALVILIAGKLKFLREPFNCPLCMGFWIGIAVGHFLFGWDPFSSALIGSSVSYLLDRLVTGEY